MTPTRSQLDAALPRVPSGIGAMSGDLTDPDERAVALDWLERLVAEAFPIPVEYGRDGMVTFRGVGFYLSEPEPVSTDPIDDEDDTDEQADGVENTIDWLTSLRQSRETARGGEVPNAGGPPASCPCGGSLFRSSTQRHRWAPDRELADRHRAPRFDPPSRSSSP